MKLEDLRKLREESKQKLNQRKTDARVKIVVGMGTSGIAAGAREVLSALLEEVEKRKLDDVIVTQSGEKGFASFEPVVEIHEEGKPKVVYGLMNPAKAVKVVAEHIVNGNIVEEYLIKEK